MPVNHAPSEGRVLCKGPHRIDSLLAVTALLDILRAQLGAIIKDHFAGSNNEILSKINWEKEVYDQELENSAYDNDSGRTSRARDSDSGRTSRASTLFDGMPGLY